MNQIPLPSEYKDSLWALYELIRRAVDGTIAPLFVDYSNQRVLMGSTTVSAAPAKVEVTGDIKVIGSANGVQLQAASGNYYRLTVTEGTGDDGSTYGVLSVTRV